MNNKVLTLEAASAFAVDQKENNSVFYIHYDNCEAWEDHTASEGVLYWDNFKDAFDYLCQYIKGYEAEDFVATFHEVQENLYADEELTYSTIKVNLVDPLYMDETEFTIKQLFKAEEVNNLELY